MLFDGQNKPPFQISNHIIYDLSIEIYQNTRMNINHQQCKMSITSIEFELSYYPLQQQFLKTLQPLI